ncbi:MAG TPA: dienelactone hydrolase family protein [Armatimonadota bacterium]
MHFALPAIAILALTATAACAAPTTLHFPSGAKVLTVMRWAADGPGRHPVVILLYGSAGPDLILSDPQYRRYPEMLSRAGFTVFMPYYFDRTGTKPHQDYSPEQFAIWVQTVRDTVKWTAARNDVQPNRIALAGLSLGAFLGLAVGTEEPRLAALAECYGGMPDAYRDRVKTMPPTLILHGQKDVLVGVEEAHKLERLFSERKVAFETHIYPEQNHGFMDGDGEDSARRMIAFFRERMKLHPPD